jgi:hypothetical protein
VEEFLKNIILNLFIAKMLYNHKSQDNEGSFWLLAKLSPEALAAL